MIMKDPAPGGLVPARERRIALACVVLASSIGFIDGSVVSVAIPAMRSDIGASFSEIQWGSYGEPVGAMAEGARVSRAHAITGAFSDVSIVTAILSALSALAAWRTLAVEPARPNRADAPRAADEISPCENSC